MSLDEIVSGVKRLRVAEINDNRQIVGYYEDDVTHRFHGFLLAEGIFTTTLFCAEITESFNDHGGPEEMFAAKVMISSTGSPCGKRILDRLIR